MECVDVSLALHALVGVSLVVAGANLMTHMGQFARGFGAYCFALGYLMLGSAASGRNFGEVNLQNRRYLIGVGSAAAIIAGTFLMYYHVQDLLTKLLKGGRLEEDLPQVTADILKSIPLVYQLLIYAGFAGLVLTIAMREDGTFNMVKGALALGSFLVVGYTRNELLKAMVHGADLEKNQVAHMLSMGLLVLAIAYNC